MDDCQKALKPCPFCGGHARLTHSIHTEREAKIDCPDCLSGLHWRLKSDAIALWNTRAQEPKQEIEAFDKIWHLLQNARLGHEEPAWDLIFKELEAARAWANQQKEE